MNPAAMQILITSWAEQCRLLSEGKPLADIARAAMNGANRLLDLHHEDSVPPVPPGYAACGGWGFYMAETLPDGCTHLMAMGGAVIARTKKWFAMDGGMARIRPLMSIVDSTRAALEYAAGEVSNE